MKRQTPLLPALDRLNGMALTCLLVVASSAEAGITGYDAFKGRNFHQQSANSVVLAAESSHGTFFLVHTQGPDELGLASVQPPGGVVPAFLSPDPDNETEYKLGDDYNSLAELNAAAPNGDYAFQLFDADFNSLNAQLTLTGDAYPAGTGINNFAEAQQIDPSKPFTFHWTPPAGLGASDFVVLEVWGDSENTRLAASTFPWEPNPLPATTTSFTVPAGALSGPDLELYLIFIKVTDRDTTSIAGATGLSGYFGSTRVGLKLVGGGDTTPPSLVSSLPASQATAVPPSNPLVLTFSEPMKPAQAVNWVNVPNPSAITYVWSNGGRTLTCTSPGGFPASTLVIWSLNPAGFTDLAGNQLTGVPGGLFTTAAQTTENCDEGPIERTDFFFAIKEVFYEQVSEADPVEGGSPVAAFGSFFSPAAGTSVSAASVRLPSGDARTLNVFNGKYFLQAPVDSETALNAAYPTGNYIGVVTIAGATGNLALSMPGAPPVPKCLNYAATQAVDPAKDFTLQWNNYSGAAGNDRIELYIMDALGRTIYAAPDECAVPPRPLSNTATSVTLGAGLLQSGTTYTAELRFVKVGTFATQAVPSYKGGAGYSKVNRFALKTTGGSSGGTFRIKGYQLLANGRLQLTVEAPGQQTLSLEASSDLVSWRAVGGGISGADGSAVLNDIRDQVPSQTFYRVRMP